MADSVLETLDNTPATETPAPEAGVSDSGAAKPEAASAPPQQAAPQAETTAPKETVATAEAKPDAPQDPQPDQPTWRQRLAGSNEKLAKILERYADEQAFANAHLQLVQKMSSGEIQEADKPFPENGTDEEKANWRKAHNVPEAPDGYIEKLELPDGIVPGEADMQGVKMYAALAKENNWDQKTFNQAVESYYKLQDQAFAMRDQADDQFHNSAEDELHKLWGQDYRRNVNAMHNLFAGAPDGVRESLFGGRTADGKLIGDHPEVLKWFAQLAYDINPAAAVLPSGMGPTGLKSRMDEFNAMIRDPNSAYYSGPDSEKLRTEYRQLLEAEAKINSRAA